MARKKAEDRRQVRVPLRDSLSLKEFDYLTLDEAIERLVSLRAGYGDKVIELRVEGVPYENYETYALYERRLETDKEMVARQRAEAKAVAARDARERQELARLLEKHGKPASP